MVAVFKTDVSATSEANVLLARLMNQFPGYKINFDLEDCDKILRVEGLYVQIEPIIRLLNKFSFQCLALD